ncbi:MAG: hypothetical protein U0946_04905 [Patescibacteria group bacterium]|nr:hypothetical protein [Patescibacteria group bacterium]
MKKFMAKLALASILAFTTQSFFLIHPQELDSANLTAVADTLSTSRLSFYGSLGVGHTAGVSFIRISTSGMPSTSTANLFTGDTVLIGLGIGTTAPAATYTVDDIYDTDEFTITSGLASGDNDSGDLVIATRSATHAVTFTPATSIANGAFRILIPSGTNNNNDGIPNHDGFDYGVTAPSLTAPTGGGVTSWETATATASAGTGCTAGNHCFETRYNGTNNNSGTFTFTIGGANKLLNPAAASGHTAGSADTYTVTIQHLADRTQNYAVIDSTTVKIALVESVRVTATVDPTINFTLAGVAASSSRCGTTTTVTSTATAVPLGTLAIDSFSEAAQNLKVSTNAVGGYAVTTIENDQLGKDGGTATFIPDTSADGAATEDVWDDWSTTTPKGFGYSIQNNDAFDVTFTYASASASCAGTFCTRRFPAAADTESVRQLFYSSTVADSEDIDICYRAVISNTQAAGDYENNITYTATATF